MIFIIGFILCLIGLFTFDNSMESHLANRMGHFSNRDYAGAIFVAIGCILMVISLGMLAWEYLP